MRQLDLEQAYPKYLDYSEELNVNKSSGPDDIHPSVQEEMRHNSAELLAVVLQ